MIRFLKKWLFPCLLMCGIASAQRSAVTSFAPSDVHDSDAVALSSLVPTINLTLLPKPSGVLPGSLTITSPQTCYEVINGTTHYTYCGTKNAGATPVPLAQFYFIPQEMMGMTAAATYSTQSPCFYTTATRLLGADGISSYHIPSTQVSTTCTPNSATVTTDDGTGLTATLTASSATTPPTVTPVTNASGWKYTALSGSSWKVADPFSNDITWINSSFTDTLGAVTTVTGSPLQSFQYNDAGGTQRTISFVSGTQTTFQPLCGQGNVGTAVTPITSISLPDGTSYAFTWDTHNSGIDGLIKSYTLRTGGQISFTYTDNGTLSCGVYNALKRTTPDGDTNYSLSQNTTTLVTTTTALDPGQNKVVYTMWGLAPNEDIFTSSVVKYQNTGSIGTPAYTEMSSTSYCYNTHISDCATYVPTYPITQLDTYEYRYNGATQVAMSHDVKQYDSHGNVTSDANTDSITGQTLTTTTVYGTDSSGTCVAITNTAIVDHPCTVITKNGSTWLSENTYSYNSNGALTSSSKCLSSTCTGTSALTTTFTPTTQGTYSAIQDPNGQTTNYTYGSCNSLVPTDITTTINSVAIDNKATWNCDSGLKTDTTDANSNEDDTAYDSMNRIHTYNDRTGDTNTTTYTYGTPTLDHTEIVDPLNVTEYQYVDSVGRPSITQVYNGTNYDTVAKAYGWCSSCGLSNFETDTSIACMANLDTNCGANIATSTYSSPIVGVLSTGDVNTGFTSNSYKANDVSLTVGPAPSGENTKVVQTETDGFGRTSSTCALTSSGYNGRVACGQTMGGNGTLTSNTYSFPSAGVFEIQTTRGSQTHTIKKDAVGRVTSIQTPEAGTVTTTYDSIPANTCGTDGASSSAGDAVEVADQAGNKICNYYDGLHRLTDVGNSNQGTTNYCKRFRFDSTANTTFTAPTGYPSSGNNLIGRMFEAETDNCASTPVTITDEWFAYDVMGRMTDLWEKTPNSGSTYYHTSVTYNADGKPTALTLPSWFSVGIGWGVDTEDRWNSMTYGSTTIVSATAGNGFKYDAASRATNVPIGTAGNQDVFTYDGIGNMTEYTFNVGTKSDDGKLTWNPIGSLAKLVINDTLVSAVDSQTCAYAYDDVARLLSVSTVSGSTCNGPMTYGYDQYDNLWQSGSFSNGCSTCYSSTNNQQTMTPTLTYDSNGNVTYDQTNTYTWNVYHKLASAASGSTAATCGTSGTCYVYDALGNLVEEQFNGSNSQYAFSPIGRVAKMSGQTGVWALVSAPGHGMFWQANGTHRFVHTDWLGSGRLVYPVASGSLYNDQAYEPYGQPYNVDGTSLNIFTGDIQDDSGLGLYLTPNRNLPQSSARWLSSDPAHASWNAYSYPTDPNKQTDPTGLGPIPWDRTPISWQSAEVNWGSEDLRGMDWIAIAQSKVEAQADAIAYNNAQDDYIAQHPYLAFLKPKDQGYLSETEVKLMQKLRSGYTRQLSEALDDNDNILYRNKEELEDATYRAMEFMEQGADDPVNHTIWETEQIRANPLAADEIRATMDQIAMSQSARGDFNNIVDEKGGAGGKINGIMLGIHIYEGLRDPNNLNHKEMMWFLRALGDTTYSQPPPKIICNGHGCGSTW